MNLKHGQIAFLYFNKGDYVRTPAGVAVVLEDEKEILTEVELRYSEVNILHKSGLSSNPSNEMRQVERWALIRITQETYDDEG